MQENPSYILTGDDAIEYARERLRDYYGTASLSFPGAMADLVRVDSMTPEEVWNEAKENGLV